MSGRDDGATTVAPGVVREEFVFGYWLTGTKEALLVSGLAKEEWFWNGRRGKNGRRLMTVFFKVDGNSAKCRPSYWGNEGEYLIEITCPKAEVDKRRRAWQQEQAAKSAKNDLMLGVASTMRAFNWENDPEKAWRFPAETVEQVKRHLGEIMQLFEHGGFELRPGWTVQFDAKFQRFMQRATSAQAAG